MFIRHNQVDKDPVARQAVQGPTEEIILYNWTGYNTAIIESPIRILELPISQWLNAKI